MVTTPRLRSAPAPALRVAKNAHPRVSVILPVYNGERYLASSIESVLDQSFENFELIVINDCSEDRSREIAGAFGDPRIRILDNAANLGLPRSLNCALANCVGTYVARQDADDVSEPRRLARQVAFLDQNPDVALAGTWYTEIDAHSRTTGRRRVPCDDLDLRWALFFYCPFVHGSVMFRRREVLERVGGYSEKFPTSQDYEYWLRIANRFNVANLPERLVRLRAHAGSLTAVEGARASRGHRLRLANVGRLLDWQCADSPDCERRFAALGAVATGIVPSEIRLDRPRSAVDDLLRLLAYFRSDEKLNPVDAAQIDRAVRTKCAQALLVYAVRQVLTEPKEAQDLVRLAYKIGGAALVNYRLLEQVLLEIWRTFVKERVRRGAAAHHERRKDDATIG